MSTLIGVFLFTIPLVVLIGNDDMSVLPQAVWLQIAVPLLWMIRLARGTPDFHRWSGILKPVAALLAWTALSTLWATDPYLSERVLFRWLAAAGLGLLIATTIESRAEARRLLEALFWASIVVSVLGLLQHLAGWSVIPQAFPPAGTLGNKNVAAAFVAVMMPVGAVAFAHASRPMALAVSMGMALSFVLHTGSRAALLVLPAELVMTLCLVPARDVLRRGTASTWRAAGMGALVFVLLTSMTPSDPAAFQATLPKLISGTVKPLLRFLTGGEIIYGGPAPERAERSVAIRIGVWRNSLEMIRSAPLTGVGVGNLPVQYPRFAGRAAPDATSIEERVESAHNDFIQFAAELGLVGLGLLLWTVRAFVRFIPRSATLEDRSLLASSASGFVGVLILAAVSPTVTQPALLAVLATLLGVTLHAPGPRADSPGRSRAGFLSAAVVCVLAGVWGIAQVRADRHVLRMGYAEARQDWPLAVEEGLAARGLNPRRVDPRFGTASAMLRLGLAGEAAPLLQELLAVDPHNANALGNLGIAHEMLKDPKRAAACFERVLNLRPDDQRARAGLERNTRAR